MAGDDRPTWPRRPSAAAPTAIEIGIPFSDPLADGPTIQRAGQRALARGHDAAARARGARARCAARVERAADPDDVRRAGDGLRRARAFCADAAAAGADGLIVPDVPPDESGRAARALPAAHGIDLVPLLAPTSLDARIELACRDAGGFVYLVSVAGHDRRPRRAVRTAWPG